MSFVIRRPNPSSIIALVILAVIVGLISNFDNGSKELFSEIAVGEI